MLFSKLIRFHCFQWKLHVPSSSRLGLYSTKSLACATLRMLQKEAHARDKSSPLFSPPDHTAPCHWVFPPCERGYTGVSQGRAPSSSLSCKKLGAALGTWPINDGALSSSREKQSRYPALLRGAYWQLVPFRKGTLNPNKHPLLTPYIKGFWSNERMKLPLLFLF